MKKLTLALAAMLTFSIAFAAVAHEDEEKDGPKIVTLKGEIVDTGCYLGHGAKGADHQACALRCIANGMPMALLTDDDTLYLLTMSHEDADPFNAAKEMAALQVQVTGPLHERDGMKSIEVTAVAEVKADKK